MTNTLTDAIVELACDCLLFQDEESLGERNAEVVQATAEMVAESSGNRWTVEDCCYMLGIAAERLWRPQAIEFERRRLYGEQVRHLLSTHAS
jgi:hypothetical protein